MTEQIQKQKPSKKLEQLLTDLGPDFGKLETKVSAVFEQGKKEGFNDMEIGDMIRSAMQEHYSDRTIRRILPDTAKHPEKVRKKKDLADKLSANERPIIEAPNAKIIESINKGDVVNFDDVEDDELVASLASEVDKTIMDSLPKANPAPQQQQPSHPLSGQPQTNETQGRHNIAPEDYDLDHLHEYDKELLGRIVYWLDTNSSDLSKLVTRKSEEVVELRNENATLKKQLKPFKFLLDNMPSELKTQWLAGVKKQDAIWRKRLGK